MRQKRIAVRSCLTVVLPPSVFPIDFVLDLLDAVALFVHLRRVQRLSLADIHSAGAVIVGEA
jgi:hypothetical protein